MPETPLPPPDPCEGLDEVVVTVPAVELTCKDEHRSCEGTATFGLRNCTATPVAFVEMRIREGEGTLIFTPADQPLAPGALWTKDYTFFHSGTHSVVADVWQAGQLTHTQPVQLRIGNPARDAALEACEACDGRWGVYGMSSTEGCNCTTTDGGEECRDGDECEGSCMFERFEVVQRGSVRSEPKGSKVVVPELGRPVGRCNGSVMSFGCKSRIRSGASKEPAVTLPARAPRQCVD